MTGPHPLLVMGAGGLLGGNLVRHTPGAVAPPIPVPWDGDPGPALAEVAAWFGRLVGQGPWRVAWCAGAGVVGTPNDALAAERRSLECFLDALAAPAARCVPSQGVFFVASSAGGVHAGATDDPVTERSPARPISAYGESKFESEQMVRAWSAQTGVAAVIGRFSNLYGPGQNLSKPQGLISRLVRASLRAEPLVLFVPLDTVRDYLFAATAARRVGAIMERAATEPKGVTVKVIASGRVTTVGELIAVLHRIRKRQPPVIFATTEATGLQPRTLRFRSDVWSDLDHADSITLAEGMAAVLRDQLLALAAGTLA